jgi:4-diphosphocytidyl-2-C-methyl-D-erythritol kinase
MSITALYDLPAPAKLNLFLHVVGRRADGYHLLQSAFVLIDWCDTLHLERRSDGTLQRHDLGAALPPEDLCLKAARLLQQQSGTALGADISIDKQLPWGAGLGGGSSDAATVLLALNRLWGLCWPRSRLLALGAQVGADVPFFLGGHDAWVEGIGERLTPITLPPARYVVVKPPAGIATERIYASPDLVSDTAAATLSGFLGDTPFGYGRNDLQPVAEGLCPQVTQAATWLHERWGNSRMTGSGSAVFARITEGSEVSDAAPDLPAGWIWRKCRGLTAHPLAGWAEE